MHNYDCYTPAQAGFPYAVSQDFSHEMYTPAPTPQYQQEYHQQYVVPERTPDSPSEEAGLCPTFLSSEEGDLMQEIAETEQDLALIETDGVCPPQTLSLPFSVLREYSLVEEPEVDPDTDKKKKKKKKKKSKKVKEVEERPDPRLDMNYWLQAPTAAECCIVPFDEDPLPYELLAAM